MSLRHCLSFLYLSAAVNLPMTVQAAAKYAVTVVGAPGSVAYGINSSGAVVGQFPSGGGAHGFVNNAGVITDLGTLGGPNSAAFAINDAGSIVGQSDNADGNRRAFLWVDGAMTDLGTLGGPNSQAHGINNRGDIVGSADVAPGPDAHFSAFLLRPPALMQDLGRIEVPNPEGGSSARGINDYRKIVGGSVVGPFAPPGSVFHAFLYACEEMRDLGTLGGRFSNAYAVNKYGKIVGEASTSELMGNRAFSYHFGVMRNLGTLPGGDLSSARAINDKGQIVGFAMAGLGEEKWRKAFVIRFGQMRDLNSLVDPALGWSLDDANGINNSGQIAATGCRAGECFALRLDPLP